MAPCEASLVGISRQGRATPLCAEGCQDQAATPATVLLHEDHEVSDFPAPAEGSSVAAKLCGYHSQMYRAERYCDKCARATCFHEGTQTRDGVRFCRRHEHSPSPRRGASPAPLVRVKSSGSRPPGGPGRAARTGTGGARKVRQRLCPRALHGDAGGSQVGPGSTGPQRTRQTASYYQEVFFLNGF